MIQPNLIALLTDDDMNRLIPEELKEAAWQRGVDENGETVYTQRTWGDMTRDVHYLSWYGETIVIDNATWKGKSIGRIHVVKGRFKLEDGIDALVKENFIIIQVSYLPKFLNENNDGYHLTLD